MHVISVKLTFYLPQSFSLKDKRQVRRSAIEKTKHKFNVSIAEVDTQDVHQTLTLGIALVSGDYSHAEKSMDEVIRFLEENVDGEMVTVAYED